MERDVRKPLKKAGPILDRELPELPFAEILKAKKIFVAHPGDRHTVGLVITVIIGAGSFPQAATKCDIFKIPGLLPGMVRVVCLDSGEAQVHQ